MNKGAYKKNSMGKYIADYYNRKTLKKVATRKLRRSKKIHF